MNYVKVNKLFDSIESVGDLKNISRKENVIIIPTHGKYGKSITVILSGRIVESFYFCDNMLQELFPSIVITHKNGRLEILRKLGFDLLNVITVRSSFVKSIDQHHIGQNRGLYSRKNILIPESEIDKVITNFYGKLGGDTLWKNGYRQNTWLGKFIINSGLSESQRDFIINKISNAIRQCGDTDCCDNFRISINGNNEIEYQETLDNGCCGFFDDEIELKDGTKVKFGFNYGH